MSTIEWLIAHTAEACVHASRVVHWQPVRAPHGLGSILLGPHEDGAQALIPPGVVLLSPDETGTESVAGWRHAVWDRPALRHGGGIRDQPTHLAHESFLYVAIALQLHAPQERPWLERQVRQHLGTLRAVVACARIDGEALRERQRERDELLIDATDAFGLEWVRANATLSWCPEPGAFLEPGGTAHASTPDAEAAGRRPLRDRDPDADLDPGCPTRS